MLDANIYVEKSSLVNIQNSLQQDGVKPLLNYPLEELPVEEKKSLFV